MKNNKNKIKTKSEAFIRDDVNLGDDVELATYIDARERYDYLHREYEEIVRDNYEKLKDKNKK